MATTAVSRKRLSQKSAEKIGRPSVAENGKIG